MLDEQFNHIATLNPGKVLNYDEKEERFKVYDMCYISPKDMYALVASDHSITVYREHMAVVSDSERERERERKRERPLCSLRLHLGCSLYYVP